MNDLTGQKFSKWTVLNLSHKNNNRETVWLCQCECGNTNTIESSSLTKHRSTQCKSCSKSKHRQAYHGLYPVWANIKYRCLNENSSAYKNYGGRGITICDDWKNDFKAFYDWGVAHGYQKGLQIDRIDNDGNYEPNNCRFVDCATNIRNQRGTKLTIDQSKDIRYALSQGLTCSSLAKLYRIGEERIRLIKLNRAWV